MKISYNWLKDYISTELPAEKVSEILTSTGLEVEGLEKYDSLEGGLKGVITGEVISCKKHPDADKLMLTSVQIGNGEQLSIVCGAPNVAPGQKVLVATVGTDLPDGKGGSFTIKKSKIRGELSEGMICAEDELGLSDNHEGIMVLPDNTPVGIPAADYLELYTDEIFEIGLTPNRSDANGHIGVARDLAAVLKLHHKSTTALTYPDLNAFQEGKGHSPVTVEIKDAERCPRYSGLYLKNVKVGPSPAWLKNRLEAIGQRSLNNVVDITNYVLHEYGQPLHAFDADKIQGDKVIVSTLSENTSFTTLDEVERKLHSEDLIICDGELNGMCIAGVFGGINTGVTAKTSNVFLESAHFSPTTIRRTSTRHQLRTDAATCFEKGTDPNICLEALKRAALLLMEYAGAEIVGPIVDIYPKVVHPVTVQTDLDYINKLSGLSLSVDEVVRILEALEISCTSTGNQLTVKIPTNKPDVTRPADVVEEILRIYGLDNIPTTGRFTYSVSTSKKPDKEVLKDQLSDFLANRGMLEAMSLSITQSAYFNKLYQVEKDKLVFINNTSNVQLDVMRPDLIISLLEVALYNLNRKQNRLKIFEFGSTYLKKDDHYTEKSGLGILMSGDEQEAYWQNTQKRKVDFYSLKSEVHAILDRLGLKSYQEENLNDQRYAVGLKYFRGDKELVIFGKLKSSILRELGIRQDIYIAEFNWDHLFEAIRKNVTHVKEIGRFPEVSRDLALVIDKSIQFASLEKLALKTEKQLLKEVKLFDVYENVEQLGDNKKSYAITFVLGSNEKTLTDKDIESVVQRLTKVFENELGAEIRK